MPDLTELPRALDRFLEARIKSKGRRQLAWFLILWVSALVAMVTFAYSLRSLLMMFITS